MFLLRSCRIKAGEVKAASRYLAIFSKNHYCRNKYEACLSNLSYCMTSRLKWHLLRFENCYSTVSSNTSDFLNIPDQSQSLTSSDSFYDEQLDVTNCSESPSQSEDIIDQKDRLDYDLTLSGQEDVEHFRKINNITVRGDNIPDPIRDFEDLPIPGVLKEILVKENYSKPTPIQSQGWPVAFNGRDVVGVSQTGSGKTLVYMLPAIIHAINRNSERKDKRYNIPSPKVLVLGPTRELVQQIRQVSNKYLFASHVKAACAYGGASRNVQLNNLRGAEICIATPGRLLDYLDSHETSLKHCTYFVLDEADRMLDMGFEPQIRAIVKHIPNKRQTLMWSATWPREIENLAEDFLENYVHITIGDGDLVANPNIEQHVYVVSEEEKFKKFFSFLRELMEHEPSKVLVFAETKLKVKRLTNLLNDEGLLAWGIHGDCSQRERDRVLREFRMSSSSILIATDIASRGLDITDIQHVFNYDFPGNIEDYIHRIGRTARGFGSGQSHSFFTSKNVGVLKDLLSVLKKANQQINPELIALLQRTPQGSSKSTKRYNYKSFSEDRMTYGNEMMYGKSDNKFFNKNRMPNGDEMYGKKRFNEERRVKKDWRSYVAS